MQEIIKEKKHLMAIDVKEKKQKKADLDFKAAIINIHRFKGKDGQISGKKPLIICKVKF